MHNYLYLYLPLDFLEIFLEKIEEMFGIGDIQSHKYLMKST